MMISVFLLITAVASVLGTSKAVLYQVPACQVSDLCINFEYECDGACPPHGEFVLAYQSCTSSDAVELEYEGRLLRVDGERRDSLVASRRLGNKGKCRLCGKKKKRPGGDRTLQSALTRTLNQAMSEEEPTPNIFEYPNQSIEDCVLEWLIKKTYLNNPTSITMDYPQTCPREPE